VPGDGVPRRRLSQGMSDFPSMKARRLLAVLQRDPLGYVVARRTAGSHRVLTAPGRPRIVFSFHDRQTLPGGMVRKVLVKDVGLAEDQALDLL